MQYGNLIVVTDDKIHDRYLIIDEEVFYHLGSSINYLGKKLTQITLMEDSEVIGVIRKRVNDIEYDIYVAEKVKERLEDIKAGRVLSAEEVSKKLEEEFGIKD